MILEIAEFRVRPEQQAAFCEALKGAATTILAKSPGYLRHAILSCIETPARVVLHVEWESVEAHTVGFRQSPAFTDWRAVIGPFFAEAPQVEHFHLVASA